MTEPGRLVVVIPPPMGLDPSARAIEVLGAAAHVWEDETPEAVALLEAAAVPDDRRSSVTGTDPAAVVARVVAGDAVAVVGPGPLGAPLVGAVVDADLLVEVVPAPSPAVVALVASGLATDRVVVQGTLPRGDEPRTTALPVRGADLVATLAELGEACGPDRPVAIVTAAATWRGTVGDAADLSRSVHPGPPSRGTRVDRSGWAEADEVILVVAGLPAGEGVVDHGDEDVREALRAARARGLSPGRAAAEVAAALGRPRREVYALGAEDPA